MKPDCYITATEEYLVIYASASTHTCTYFHRGIRSRVRNYTVGMHTHTALIITLLSNTAVGSLVIQSQSALCDRSEEELKLNINTRSLQNVKMEKKQ